MKHLTFLASLFVVLLLAGCAGKGVPSEPTASGSPPEHSEQPATEPPQTAVLLPDPLPYDEFFGEVRECEDWRTYWSANDFNRWAIVYEEAKPNPVFSQYLFTAKLIDGYLYEADENARTLTPLLEENVTHMTSFRPGLYLCVIDGTEIVEYDSETGERTHLLSGDGSITWIDADLYYFYYLMDDVIYRFYRPTMTNEYIVECPGLGAVARYEGFSKFTHWSNVELVWYTMNEEFLAIIHEAGWNWDDLSDDVELDRIRFEHKITEHIGHYYNELSGEYFTRTFLPYEDCPYWWREGKP